MPTYPHSLPVSSCAMDFSIHGITAYGGRQIDVPTRSSSILKGNRANHS